MNGERRAERPMDAMDVIVDEVREWLPEVEVTGLSVTGRILRLARDLESLREETLRPFELTVGDYDMLATLRRRAAEGSMKIRDLQRSSMLSSGGTTKRLDRLEGAGLIERHPDPDDRRGTLITLSSRGLELISEAVPAVIGREPALVREAIGSNRRRETVEDGLRQMLLAVESPTDAV